MTIKYSTSSKSKNLAEEALVSYLWWDTEMSLVRLITV